MGSYVHTTSEMAFSMRACYSLAACEEPTVAILALEIAFSIMYSRCLEKLTNRDSS
jgi:hypothetical protein